MRLAYGCGTGLRIDWYENNRVEFLCNYCVKLIVLRCGTVPPVKYCYFDLAARDSGLLIDRANPKLHEFRFLTVHRCSDLHRFGGVCGYGSL
jgi:hypothetical protein